MKYKISSYLHVLICFCLLTIAMTIFMLSNKNYIKAEQKIVDFDNTNIEYKYLYVTDVYGQDNQKTLFDFFAEKNSLERMKQFYVFLNEEFNYFEFDKQNLLIRDEFNYKDEFRIDYEWVNYGVNDDIGISLKSLQIGKNTYDVYNLQNKLAEGRGFEPDDYIFDNNKTVPAILGYEYSGLVNIGDTIRFEYLFKNITIEVIGFFQKDTSLTLNNNICFMDQSIVIPLLNLNYAPLNKDDEKFQKILYNLKTCQYIKIKDGEDYYGYKNKIDKISKELDLKYILNEAYIHEYIKNISHTINSGKGIFLIASIILFLILSTIIGYVYIWNFNRNKKMYSIDLICGCSFPRLKLRIFFKIFIQFILSIVAAIFINRLMLGYDNIYVSEKLLLGQAINQTLTFSMAIMVAICLVINVYINNSNIYSSIRKEN